MVKYTLTLPLSPPFPSSPQEPCSVLIRTACCWFYAGKAGNVKWRLCFATNNRATPALQKILCAIERSRPGLKDRHGHREEGHGELRGCPDTDIEKKHSNKRKTWVDKRVWRGDRVPSWTPLLELWQITALILLWKYWSLLDWVSHFTIFIKHSLSQFLRIMLCC